MTLSPLGLIGLSEQGMAFVDGGSNRYGQEHQAVGNDEYIFERWAQSAFKRTTSARSMTRVQLSQTFGNCDILDFQYGR